MKVFLGLAVFSILMLVPSTNISAQGMCVIPEQKINAIKGVVSYVADENTVQGANIKLKRDDRNKAIAETETAEDGSFQIKGSYKGTYILVVSRPNAVSLHIPIQIVKGKTENYLHVTLGAIIGETCGGGDVKLVTKN